MEENNERPDVSAKSSNDAQSLKPESVPLEKTQHGQGWPLNMTNLLTILR